MAVDLYQSNFQNVGKNLEDMYQQYLVEYETKKKKDSQPRPHSSKDHKTEKSAIIKNKPKGVKEKKVRVAKRTEEEIPVSWDEEVVTKTVSPKTPEGSPPSLSPETKNLPETSKKPHELEKKVKSEPVQPMSTKNPQKLPKELAIAPKKELVENSYEITENKLKSDISLAAEETVTAPAESNGHELSEDQSPLILPETSDTSEESKQNGNSEEATILKQQNSQQPPVGATPKTKVQKVYFREENTENLTWTPNLEELDTSPKVNPFSKSFLTFLGNNNWHKV